MEIAVRISSFESLKLLVEAGAKMDQGDFMHQACEQDHIEMMKVVLLFILKDDFCFIHALCFQR